MPITGHFDADFGPFLKAVQDAQIEIKQFEDGAAGASTQLSKMVNAFTGRDIMQQAAVAAEAVNRIGGVSKLTEKELADLGGTAREAVEKMRAMGVEIPPGIQAIADAANNAQQPTEGLGSRITGLVEASRAAIDALRESTEVLGEWIDEANAGQAAATRLETAMRLQGTSAAAAQYDALATSLQNSTIYSADLNREMIATLATIGGVLPQDMGRALQASADLAAGLRIDLPQATQMVARAMEGNTTALKKYGLDVDEFAVRTRGATAVIDVIAEKMGGQAAAQAATFGGQLEQLKNKSSDVKQSLGGLITDVVEPAVKMFRDLPEPVQKGAIALGLIATAAGTLALGIAGVTAAIGLAAPALGFTTAAGGAAAMGTLGISIGAVGTALGAAALAAVGFWAALKVGEIPAVRDSIATWALASDDAAAVTYRWAMGLEKMSLEQARAAVAATGAAVAAADEAKAHERAAAATGQQATATADYVGLLAAYQFEAEGLSDELQRQIIAGDALGISHDKLAASLKVSEGAIKLVVSAHQQAEAAAKKHAEEEERAAEAFKKAVEDVDAKSANWRTTLDSIDGAVVENAKHLIDQGVSLENIARYYGLTATQAQAVKTAVDLDTEARKRNAEALKAVNDLWKEYMTTTATQGTTQYQQQIDEVYRWRDAQIEAAAAAGTATTDFFVALEATTTEKLRNISVDWQAINDVMTKDTKQGLEEVALKAEATYAEALKHVGEWSDATIQKFRDQAEAARLAANSWGTGMEDNAKKAGAAVDGVTQKLKDQISATYQTSGTGAAPGSTYGAPMFAGYQPGAFGFTLGGSSGGTRQVSLSEALSTGVTNTGAPLAYQGGSTLPTGASANWIGAARRADGGPVSPGQAYMVGERGPELFAPTSAGSILSADDISRVMKGGGAVQVSNVFHIVDTADNLARRVGEEITRSVMNGRKLS